MSNGNHEKKCVPTDKDARNLRNTVVMFVDIVGASEASNYMKPQEYSKFVSEFQQLFLKVCEDYTKANYKKEDKHFQFSARGDEGLFMVYPPPKEQKNLSKDVDVGINIALALKRQWICDRENKNRICKYGLLPVDLGVGIHVGKTYLNELNEYQNKLNPGGWRPEGYSINLAKRIENESRSGKYTRILISEAAHGELNYLPDEQTYVFDEQQSIQPKGISRDIRVFEVMHHFLPTDWTDLSSTKRRSQTMLGPDEANVKILLRAHEMNPTNIWLAEECVRTSLLTEYYKLKKKHRDNKTKLKKAFQRAKDIADDLAHGDQRDAAAMFIQGLIEGECLEFEEERKRYEEARGFTKQLAIVDWYHAVSCSNEVLYAINMDYKRTFDKTENVRTHTATELKDLINDAIVSFKKAKARSPRSAWIKYDYGRELVRWKETSQKYNHGIREIKNAFDLLKDEVAKTAKDDEYLENVKDDPVIKKILEHAEKLN